jgi:hypothetical protein
LVIFGFSEEATGTLSSPKHGNEGADDPQPDHNSGHSPDPSCHTLYAKLNHKPSHGVL